jgi:cyclophilin family peptidyl-prolyl cis-trans isomerase
VHVTRLLVVFALVAGLAGCGSGDDNPEAAPPQTTTPVATGGCETAEVPTQENRGAEAPSKPLDAAKTYKLVFDTNCGAFTIELDQKQAPKTAASLVSLARVGFFDGTTFHRVVPGFVIQGGDPTGTGAGGPGYQTVDPPPQSAAYTRGVVAMAKTAVEPAGTSGSQFFVVTGANVGLPPDYAIVGKVTAGLKAVDAIAALGVGDGPPSQPVVIRKVTVEES